MNENQNEEYNLEENLPWKKSQKVARVVSLVSGIVYLCVGLLITALAVVLYFIAPKEVIIGAYVLFGFAAIFVIVGLVCIIFKKVLVKPSKMQMAMINHFINKNKNK